MVHLKKQILWINLALLFPIILGKHLLLADLIDDDEIEEKSSASPVLENETNEYRKVIDQKKSKSEKPTFRSKPEKKSPKNKSQPEKSTIGIDSNKSLPVHFKSEGMKVSREKGLALLKKNVKVIQGDFHLASNEGKVFYSPETNEVIRVEASGNVRMRKGDFKRDGIKATSKEMVYYNLEQKILLHGNAKLWRGGDVITGNRIEYDLRSGWVHAEKVEGVVKPEASEGK